MLLKEAQQEIALLRTDLFNTRRLAEERRQAVDTLQAERERLTRHCDDVEAKLRAANAQLNHIPEYQQRCAQLDAQVKRLTAELETSVAARRILQQELDDERRQRTALVEQKAMIEGERARLSKQRDDLAAQVRLEQRKAREAEEEQVRAEEDCAALRAELAALQASHAQAAHATAPLPPHVAAAAASASGGSAPSSASHHSAADTAAAIAAAVAAATTPLIEQVENERNRAALLLSNLHAAKNEIIELTQRLADFEARHADSLAHGHDHDHLSHQVAELQEQEGQLAQQLTASQARVRQLESELQQLRQQHQQLQQQLAGAPPPPPLPPVAPGPHHHRRNSSGDGSAHGPGPASALLQHHAGRLLGDAGRVTSTNSLYQTGEGSDSGEEEAARLRQVVARLKASRDKLLTQIDKQWEEIERLSTENSSMGEELHAAKALAANWEAQAQDALARIEQLKDLLEDSARWGQAQGQGSGAAGEPGAQGAQHGGEGAGTGAPAGSGVQQGGAMVVAGGGSVGPTVQALQAELLGEKVRAGELELQLRAVAAELLRSQHSSLELGRSFLPVLAGVEKRLSELCQKAVRRGP